MEPIRFVIVDEDSDSPQVLSEDVLKSVDVNIAAMKDDEEIQKLIPKAHIHTVFIKKPTGLLQQEIERKCLIPDDVIGFRRDPSRVPAARAATMIASWDFIPLVSMEGFLSLHPNICNLIDMEIQRRMYPNAAENPDFFDLLKRKLESQQGNTPESQNGETSIQA